MPVPVPRAAADGDSDMQQRRKVRERELELEEINRELAAQPGGAVALSEKKQKDDGRAEMAKLALTVSFSDALYSVLLLTIMMGCSEAAALTFLPIECAP